MQGKYVNPEKWTETEHLFDCEWYSAVWGYYENSSKKALGVRWNGALDETGYPSQGKYPTWYVEPDFLTLRILEGLALDVAKNPAHGDLEKIMQAIAEFKA